MRKRLERRLIERRVEAGDCRGEAKYRRRRKILCKLQLKLGGLSKNVMTGAFPSTPRLRDRDVKFDPLLR